MSRVYENTVRSSEQPDGSVPPAMLGVEDATGETEAGGCDGIEEVKNFEDDIIGESNELERLGRDACCA
jgi:hypothetical protein